MVTLAEISPDDIDLNPGWNLHPLELEVLPDTLEQSLHSSGILHPPYVIRESKKERSRYHIVCGYRRIMHIKTNLSGAKTFCYVLDSDIPPERLLHIILDDQLFSGTALSFYEKARFFEIASRYFSVKEIISIFGSKLGALKGNFLIRNYKSIVALDKKIIHAIHSGNLQDQMIKELLQLPYEEDRKVLVTIFSDLQLGTGKQRRLFQLLRDVAYKNQEHIHAFVRTDKIHNLLTSKELNKPQILQHLLSLLHNKLHPLSVEAKQQFSQEINALNLNQNVSIEPSPSFEKDEVTLSIIFKDLNSCKQYLKSRQQC